MRSSGTVRLAVLAALQVHAGCRVDVCKKPSSKFRVVLTAPQSAVPEHPRLVVDAEVEFQNGTVWRRHGVYRPGADFRDGNFSFIFDPQVEPGSDGTAREATVRLGILVLDERGSPVSAGTYEGEVRTDRCLPDAHVSLASPECSGQEDGARCWDSTGAFGVCQSGHCVVDTCGKVAGIQPYSGEVCDGGWACDAQCRLRPALLDLADATMADFFRIVHLGPQSRCSADDAEALYADSEFSPPEAFRRVPLVSVVLADLAGEAVGGSGVPDSQFVFGLPGYGESGLVAALGFGFLSGMEVRWTSGRGSFFEEQGSGGLLGLKLAVGDVDGDGYRDVVASEPLAAHARLHLLLSSTSFDEKEGWTTGEGHTVTVDGTEKFFGYGVALADLDADGVAEVVVGAPLSNGVRGKVVIYGGGSFGASGGGKAAGTFVGPAVNGAFGAAVAAADFDGEGSLDLAVGMPSGHSGSLDTAHPSVYLLLSPLASFTGENREVRCRAGGCGDHSLVLAAPGRDASVLRRFGAVLAAGDLDQDGCAELVVSAPGDASAMSRVYVYAGTDLAAGVSSGATAVVRPRLALEAPGDAALGAGLLVADVNHDKVPDLVVSAPLRDEGNREDAGAVYVFLGSLRWSWPQGTEVLSLDDLEATAAGPGETPAGDFHGMDALVIRGPGAHARLGIALAAGPLVVPDVDSTLAAVLALGYVDSGDQCAAMFLDICRALDDCGGTD